MKRKRRDVPAAEPKTREQLEAEHGQVWDMRQLAEEFVITSIIGSTVIVRRKSDNVVGSMEYQTQPGYFFGFRPQPQAV